MNSGYLVEWDTKKPCYLVKISIEMTKEQYEKFIKTRQTTEAKIEVEELINDGFCLRVR
jgi:hypothetical protein